MHLSPQTGQETAFTAIIPAGGVGTRLWPLSRPSRPKFLLDLLGTGETLIQATVNRVAPISDDVVIVTGVAHADAVAEQLPQVSVDNIIAEPTPRDSMAAIALAAAVIEQRQGPRIVGSFAADHVIPDAQGFHDTVRKAIEVAQTGKVVTIGIDPTGPSTAFGYIALAEALVDAPGVQVSRFVEKPDAERAAKMLADGNYVWNAGMFVVRTDVLLGHLAALQPGLHAGVREIAAAWDTPARADVLERVWPTLTKIAIDHAIAEPVADQGGIACVPGSFAWDDVGDFDALATVVGGADDAGVINIARQVPAYGVDATGVVAVGGQRKVVVVGFDDAVVVETDDVVLVVNRAKAQAVKDAAQLFPG